MRASSSAVLVLVLAGACTMTSSLGGGGAVSGPPPVVAGTGKLAMIDLTGKTAGEAEAALRAAGFTPSFEVNRILLECEGAAQDVGRINCQSPAPGALVDRAAIVNVTVYEGARTITGALVRAQLEKARGMTIPQAKAYLASIGHDGEVSVFAQPVFADSCGAQRVCSVQPESGTGIHDPITLVINPGANAEITAPPP